MSALAKGAIGSWLNMVKFSHSIFALPFALSSAWLASGGLPEPRVLVLIVLCTVAARTAAMAFNRLVDRRIDGLNPRTQNRELVSGEVSTSKATLGVLISSAIFIAGAFALNPLSGWLSIPVLIVLLGYSFTKRVTWLAHLVLGLALGLAPLGAWLAVTGTLESDIASPLLLALAVMTWVAGFDLIYSCQDAEFDRKQSLHSIPARFGIARALRWSVWLHVVTAAALIVFGSVASLGGLYWGALVLVLALLIWQHKLVSADDLSRVDMAFFTLNGWVGVLLFIGLAADLAFWNGVS
ncbi:MAG: 4-hydroxybenzoate polyprenyltransferase [Planctomycetota bacterium]|jgi:4-hydroxybenzoate polyprenyltransferase